MDSHGNLCDSELAPRYTFDLFQSYSAISHGSFSGRVNLNQIRKILQIDHLIQNTQMHGDHIRIIESPNEAEMQGDALITSKPGIGLLIKQADCQAALMFDPVNQVIAAVHAGWRGQVASIYTKTIETLEKVFGTKRENLLVAISPSLGPKFSEFIHYKEEFPESFWQYRNSQNYFNLWDIALDELLAAKIHPDHIQIARVCTYENQEYFSYRRDKTTDRQVSVIALR